MRMPLFRSVPESELQDLCIKAPLRLFEPGQLVYSEGVPSDGTALLVVHGKLRVEVGEGPGRRVLHDVKPGELVGEVALFYGGRPRSASVVAELSSRCLRVDWGLLDIKPPTGAIVAIEQHLLGTLSRRIRRTTLEIQRVWKEQATPDEGVQGASISKRLAGLFGVRS